MPSYEGVDVKDILDARKTVSAIESVFSITFEKKDTEIKGSGALNISKNGDLRLRVYSFGFLAFELISEDGMIKSNPIIDRNKGMILAYGLRDCLFWWDIRDSEIIENKDGYLLKNLSRMVWMDKKTMLPTRQTILLEDGRDLNIFYENPEKANDNDIWYPSKIRIELSKYAVTLKIKDMLFVLDV